MPGDQEVRHAGEVGPDRVPGDVLAEPDGERARGRGQVVVDVAERDEARREVRYLDADRLLPRDRREDPDLRRRERVREVVAERRDLRDLRPRARAAARSASRAGPRSGPRPSPRRRTRASVRTRSSAYARAGVAPSSPRLPASAGGSCGREAGTRRAPTTSRTRSRCSRRLRARSAGSAGRAAAPRRAAARPRRRGRPPPRPGAAVAALLRLRGNVERLVRLRLERGPVERAAGLRAGVPDDVAGAAQDRAGRGAAHEQRARRAGACRRRSPRPCRRSGLRALRRARARSSRRCPCRAGS